MDIIEKYYYSEKEQKLLQDYANELLQDYANELAQESSQHSCNPE